MNNNEFNKFARMHQGISSTTLSRYQSAVDAYINPSIIEERKLNVAQMDVFSRLMMDRIIFLGVQIDDDVAKISSPSCSSSLPWTLRPIFPYTSILPAGRSPAVLPSMTQCS